MKEALFYTKTAGMKVNCELCAHYCKGIADGSSGFCGVRKNIKGKLWSTVYGKVCSLAMDPIEKKPLFHFAPGTECLSMATMGCNFRCRHCQNWEISQEYGKIGGEDISPEQIVEAAKARGAKGIAYTYTEPTIFYEYAYDTMKLAKKAGLYNVWVSNGYTAPEAIKKVSKYLNAVNVDLKGDDVFYRKVCMAPGLQPVLDALLEYKKHRVWTEITTLVIPGYNDSQAFIRKTSRWIHDNLGPDVPYHLSAFYPTYKLTEAPPTSKALLEKCYRTAKKAGLRWVYLGNVHSGKESTYCPKCGQIMVERSGYNTIYYGDRCEKCGARIPIAGKKWL